MDIKRFSPVQIYKEGVAKEQAIKQEAGLSPNALYTEGGIHTTLEVQKVRLMTIAKTAGVSVVPPLVALGAYHAVEAIGSVIH